jgi:hypothetical protein
MSCPSPLAGDQNSTNVLNCQVLDAAGKVAGWRQDATRTEAFSTAGNGQGGLRQATGCRAGPGRSLRGVFSGVRAWRGKRTAAGSFDVRDHVQPSDTRRWMTFAPWPKANDSRWPSRRGGSVVVGEVSIDSCSSHAHYTPSRQTEDCCLLSFLFALSSRLWYDWDVH